MGLEPFAAAYEASTQRHPFARHLRVWQDKACFEVKVNRAYECVLLNYIMTLEKGAGHGTEALRWFVSLARAHQVRVEGHVQRIGTSGLKQSELRAWYKRHGFRVNRSGELVLTP